MVTLLISHGADVNSKNEDGASALILAVANRDLNAVRVLLRAGADPNTRNPAGTTVLQLAAEQRQRANGAEIFELLSAMPRK